mmetsp:Transcript_6785/g.20085  ORF Transcript_6785/g.20085 Transcript_6785/m.20085 type:complete len:293 (-) Transcript_6785:478-1356(-)
MCAPADSSRRACGCGDARRGQTTTTLSHPRLGRARPPPGRRRSTPVAGVLENLGDLRLRTRSYPVAGVLEDLGDLRLRTALLGFVAVLPARRLRQAHEDRLDAAPRLEPEDGPAVVDEVELHVAAAAHLLPLLLLLREGVVLVLLHERHVGGDDGVGAVFGEGEDLVRGAVVVVVEEDAPEPAGLAAVLDDEVLVRPLFELGVVFRIVLVAHLLVGAVEVLHVLLVEVGGGDVRAAAEPPDAAVRLEVAVVEVHGGGEGVARVHHGAKAAGEEGHAVALLVALGAVHAALRR